MINDRLIDYFYRIKFLILTFLTFWLYVTDALGFTDSKVQRLDDVDRRLRYIFAMLRHQYDLFLIRNTHSCFCFPATMTTISLQNKMLAKTYLIKHFTVFNEYHKMSLQVILSGLTRSGFMNCFWCVIAATFWI